MRIIFIGFGVLLFAVVTAGLVLWGMRKAYFQRENLMKMLLSKSAAKVMEYLKTHGSITEAEMTKLVDGVSASEVFSRNRAVVQGRAFTKQLIDVMTRDGLIECVKQGKTVYYKRKEKMKK